MTPVINTAADVLRQSDLRGLSLLARGKVRDIYAVDDARLLIVQSDRISAFDVVMDEAIPGKGAVLNRHVAILVFALRHRQSSCQ